MPTRADDASPPPSSPQPSLKRQQSPASLQWRAVVDQARPKLPKLAAIMDDTESDVLACMIFPKEHWATLYSRTRSSVSMARSKRRTDVVGILPNDDAIVRLVGAILLEHQRVGRARARYMTLETIAPLSADHPGPAGCAATRAVNYTMLRDTIC